MRKTNLIFFLLAVITGFAQEKPAPKPAPTPQPAATPSVSPTAPEITFEQTNHDFGTVKKGSPVVYQFKFKNTGKEPLIIYDCKAGCHCTTPMCPKDAIKPGKSGFIEVHYDSMRVGNFAKEVIINSNAKTPHISVVIRGIIDGEAEGTDQKSPAKNEEKMKAPVQNKE